MNIKQRHSVDNIFFLGAGASVEYGLPTWNDLTEKIKGELLSDRGDRFFHKKELLDWVEKSGEGKKYPTIDECIKKESTLNRAEGDEIEIEMFSLIKEILAGAYKPNQDGWIQRLNHKILQKNLESRIAIANFNYDDVLARNLLVFDHLAKRERRWDYNVRLKELADSRLEVLYPHGNLFPVTGNEYPAGIFQHIDTIKSGPDEPFNAVSCFDGKTHGFSWDYGGNIRVLILGLGGGMQINLPKVELGRKVTEVHVTIHNPEKREETLKILQKMYPLAGFATYADCAELIEAVF